MTKENISVVLIAHNEEKVIGKMIEGLLLHYENRILELIVVDDASTDTTASIVERWKKNNKKVRLVKRAPPCGVGRAIKTGFASVDPKAEYVLTMDSDFIESIREVSRLIDEIGRKGCDGIMGSRFIEGSRLRGYPPHKKVMNRIFHYTVSALFGIRQKDLSNNFKLYKYSVIQSLPWRSNGFSINAETGILPILGGYDIREVPVSWVGRNRGMGISKFKLLRVVWGYMLTIPHAIWFSLGCRLGGGHPRR